MRLLAACLLWLVLAAGGQAHPLGPPNADSLTTFQIRPDGLTVSYAIVFKEASALTIIPQLDHNQDGQLTEPETLSYVQGNQQHFLDNLHLKLDGKPVPTVTDPAQVSITNGAGGLSELHSNYALHGLWKIDDTQKHVLEIDDESFRGVGGWREIRPQGQSGIGLLAGPNPPQNAVEALQTTARIEFHQGPNEWVPGTTSVTPNSGTQNRMLEMVTQGQTPKVLMMTLLVSYVLGALHGLQPGHGKTVVGAYLIGSRGTIGHALFLGLVVTITHTASVIGLGLFCLLAFKTVPQWLIPWIGCCSGLLISVMGYLLITNRWTFGHSHSHDHGHGHGHDHSHSHAPAPVALAPLASSGYAGTVSAAEVGPALRVSQVAVAVASPAPAAAEADPWAGHGHSHAMPERLNFLGLLSLGISGGLVPCPDAIIVLLGAIHINKLWLGLIVLLAFSAGLASILMAVGVLMVTAASFIQNRYPSHVTVRRVSELSYLAIILMGLGMAFHSLWSGGVIKL